MERFGVSVTAPISRITFGCRSRRIRSTSLVNSRMSCAERSWSKKRFTATSVPRHNPRCTSPYEPMPMRSPSWIVSGAMDRSTATESTEALCSAGDFSKPPPGESRDVPDTSRESVATVADRSTADVRSTSPGARGITPNPPFPTAGSCPGITPNDAPASSPRPKYRHSSFSACSAEAPASGVETDADAGAVPGTVSFAFAALDVLGVSDGLARPGGAYAAKRSDMTSDTSLPRLPCAASARGSPVCGSVARGRVEASSDSGGGARDLSVGGKGSAAVVVRTGAGVDDRSASRIARPVALSIRPGPSAPAAAPASAPSSAPPFSSSSPARSNRSNCLGTYGWCSASYAGSSGE